MVAENMGGRRSCSARPPITDSDDPYIGDESITRPPAARKSRITGSSVERDAGESPTSNVIHVPSPITGTRSPVDGIGRV